LCSPRGAASRWSANRPGSAGCCALTAGCRSSDRRRAERAGRLPLPHLDPLDRHRLSWRYRPADLDGRPGNRRRDPRGGLGAVGDVSGDRGAAIAGGGGDVGVPPDACGETGVTARDGGKVAAAGA
jgi:hypothetical protein